MNLQMYVKTESNNIVVLNGKRSSFKCRQRNKDKKNTLRFVSYKTMMKEKKKYNSRVIGSVTFNTMSKL